jgi:hypothetical protein
MFRRLIPLTRSELLDGREGTGGITKGSKRRHIRVRWLGQGRNGILPRDSRTVISMTRIPRDAGNRLSGWADSSKQRQKAAISQCASTLWFSFKVRLGASVSLFLRICDDEAL